MFRLAFRCGGRPKGKYQQICKPKCLLKLLTSWHLRVNLYEWGILFHWKGTCIGLVDLAAAAVLLSVVPMAKIRSTHVIRGFLRSMPVYGYVWIYYGIRHKYP
jgi:hypothetical protein